MAGWQAHELNVGMTRKTSMAVLQARLASWQREKQTNRHGFAKQADHAIAALIERIRRERGKR